MPDTGRAPVVRIRGGPGETTLLNSGLLVVPGDRIEIETDRFHAAIATEGYVSGVAAGSFIDKATGAHDLGFGLSIVDFLLEPTSRDKPVPKGQYEYDNLFHGKIAKRYVEGPQICTQAKQLSARVGIGDRFITVRFKYQWDLAYAPRDKAGSIWEQTLIFPQGERFFLSADRVTTVSESEQLVFRVDMPGHIRRDQNARTAFDHIYLSYNDPPILPSTEFDKDFGPDEHFLYQRRNDRKLERFIRAYQVDLGPGKEAGPWLAGMTLNPDDVYEAWCHERGYVCLIEELGGRPTKPGDTFGACYLVGWFDDVATMHEAYDRYRGTSGLAIEGAAEKPTGFRKLKQSELTAVSM